MAKPTAFDPERYSERLLRQFPPEARRLVKPLHEKVVSCVIVNHKATFYFKDEFVEYAAKHQVRDLTICTTDGCGYSYREVEEATEMKWFTPQL